MIHPLFEALKPLVDDLTKAIGVPCEVVLHDYGDPTHSIIAISGNLTGRQVGGPLTDLGLRILHTADFEKNLIGYATTLPDGRPLRSSSLFLRDENGKVIGALCINIDLTYWNVANKVISDFCAVENLPFSEGGIAERFDNNVSDVLRASVDSALKSIEEPIPLMSKESKLKIIRNLENSGIFLIRGSIDYVATVLGVSRATLYNYLAELRSSSRFAQAP